MVKIFKLFLLINLFFAIISCSQPNLTYSGKIIDQKNLNNLNISNKNYLVKNFGQPSFIDPIENKYFYYSEKTKENNFFSKKKEYSYIFVFEFDNNDEVVDKKVLDLNSLQKIKINKMRTTNRIVKRGLIEKIFGGVGTQKVPNTNY